MSLSRSEQNELKERLKSQHRERHIKEPKNRISLDRGVTKLSELTRSDRKYIENLYVDLSKDISDEMRRLSITPQTNTVKLEKFRLTQLQKSVDRELAHIRDETQTRIMSSMTMAAQSVSQSNVDWLSSMGLKFYHTPAAVPADVIANLVSGRVYANNWEFSKAIWGDYRQSKGDLANIIAKGVAAGKSTYDIAVDLQTYVSPKAAKPWDWSKVYPHSKKKIDYNAQRLARTMVAHAYQQSVIETSKANPFVYTVQWRSAMEHNRTCLICEQRNGNIYPLDNVPLDHPNGLCTIFPVIQGSLKDVAGQLADWVNGNADERFEKKMDGYIDFLGFDPQKIRALTLAAGSLSRSVFSVGAGAAGNVRNDINNADLGLTDGGDSGIIEKNKRMSVDGQFYEEIGKIDPLNQKQVETALNDFEEKYRNSEIEHCIVITETGKVYEIHGTRYKVNTELLGDEMKNSINEHNHVTGESEYSFSWFDFNSSIKENSSISIAYDEKYRYSMTGYKEISKEEAYYIRKKAEENVYNRIILFEEEIPDEEKQHEFIKEACRLLGIKYEREKL